MKANYEVLAVAALLPLLAGCPGVLELKSKVATAAAAQSTVAPILFDDFEKGVAGTWNYGDASGGGACTAGEELQVSHSGSKSLRIDYKTGTGAWGCGFGFQPSYTPKDGYYNAKGTLGVEFWAKGPRGVTFQMQVKEATAGGGDGEVYLAPPVTGSGGWKRYYLKYESCTRGIYSGNQAGDDHLEPSGLVSLDFQFDPKQGDGALYLDDIYFK